MPMSEASAMVATTSPMRPSASALHASLDFATSADVAFRLICEVEKWPLWFSFLVSARRTDAQPLCLGSEVALRGAIPGEPEELYEVDQFLDGHIVSLVGAYSVRRRIDFRIERKSERSKLIVRVDYPAYGGALGSLVDRLTNRRRLSLALEQSLEHFGGLVEFKGLDDPLLADF
jgi:hypothetical protein